MIATTILQHAREIYGDLDTTNPGVSDTILFEMLNPIVRAIQRRYPRSVWRTSTTMGWTISANSLNSTTTGTDIIDTPAGPGVVGAFLEAAAGDAKGTPLRRMRPSRIMQLQVTEATTGTIARYSIERAATVTEADHGKLIFRWHPIPAGTSHVSARVVAEPETIDAGADGVDLDDDACYAIGKILALQAAPLVKQPPSRIDEIRKSIPAVYRQIWEQPIPPLTVAGEK
jgi:hypothetical protein